MKEQSHKDEMSAALRGDFERLRERGVALTLTPSEPEPAPPLPADPPPADAGRDAHAAAFAEDVAAHATPGSRGWLGRLLGR